MTALDIGPSESADYHQTLTREELQERIQHYNKERERFDVAPDRTQLLGPFTVFCLIMNRTIATGIFTQPVNVLNGAGSPGIAIVLWFAAGIIVVCVVASWVEFALTVPIHYVFRRGGWERISAPRSGGDKNYLEYTFRKPRYFMTCIFGIVFIIFGNLAGNALQFGVYMQIAIAKDPLCDNGGNGCTPKKGPVVAWAVGVLTFCALVNLATRKYALGLNNLFAVAKLAFVVAITFVGIIYGTINGNGCRRITWQVDGAGTRDLGDMALALFYAMYPYTGFEQPFYVLSEIARPQKVFARAIMSAMLTVLVLFPLTNVSYLCMVPFHGARDLIDLGDNMALLYFQRIAGGEGRVPVVRGVSALIAFFILGNLMAQTYTASRVKQEVAKEGILPWSLLFATSNDTLLSRLSRDKQYPYRGSVPNLESHREQAPFAATALHWAFEVILVVVVGLTTEPSEAYGLLTYLYTFVIVGILGFFTVGGLLYLKLDSLRGLKSRGWSGKTQWRPYLDPLPAWIATTALAFLLFAAFLEPSRREEGTLRWWIAPTVGWASVALGVGWWLGLRFVQWAGRWELNTKRLPVVEIDEEGRAVQRAEVVEYNRIPVEGGRR